MVYFQLFLFVVGEKDYGGVREIGRGALIERRTRTYPFGVGAYKLLVSFIGPTTYHLSCIALGKSTIFLYLITA